MSDYKYSTSLYIGNTTGGVDQPVFFDLHTPIRNNKPPATLVTGAPGSGKTFWAMTLAAMSAILGKTTIILDPKGDFLALKEIQDDIGDITLWNLSSRDKQGVLDPFLMTKDPRDQLDLATNVIDMLMGGLTPDETTALAPILKDVCDEPNPSMMKVLNELNMSRDNKTARNIGSRLGLISNSKFANLLFSNGQSKKRQPLSISEGTTVITMVGMELTPTSGNDAGGGSVNHRRQLISSTVFYLITDFIRRIMEEEKSPNPKVLIIDEAWAVTGTQAGAEVVKSVALLGRSKNLALALVTQNTSHMKHLDIENTITTHFAFRTDQSEATQIVKDMRLPLNEGKENTLLSLDTGECLMKDFRNKYSTVKISNYKKDWEDAFRTNPIEKQKARKAREEAKRLAERNKEQQQM